MAETRADGGDGQIRLPGTALVERLIARAVYASGQPIRRAGLTVTWSVVTGGGTLVGPSESGAGGGAIATWTLGPTLGEQTVEVTIGSGAPATFTARAVELGPITFASSFGAALVNNYNIFAVHEDGTDPVPLTSSLARDRITTWIPNDGGILVERLGTTEAPGTNALRLDPVTLAESVLPFDTVGSDFDWSPDRSLVVFYTKLGDPDCVTSAAEHALWTAKADGSDVRKLTDSVCRIDNKQPDWSPDGSLITYESEEGEPCPDGIPGSCNRSSIWVMDADGSNKRRVSGGLGNNPHWLPDGERIVFGGYGATSGTSVRILDVDTGLTSTVWVVHDATYALPGGVSPDGKFAVVQVGWKGAAGDVFIVDLQTGDATNLTNRPDIFDGFPSWKW